MKPSVGRIVHYVAFGTPGGEFQPGACRAAVVTHVVGSASSGGKAPQEFIGVCVLNPNGLYFNQSLIQDEVEKAPGSWHWPERVEE